jgi:hypothetical protein
LPYAARSFDAPPVRASHSKEHALATPNYGYEKRQRELAKKRKAEEKKQKKLHPGQDEPGHGQGSEPSGEVQPGAEPPAPPAAG